MTTTTPITDALLHLQATIEQADERLRPHDPESSNPYQIHKLDEARADANESIADAARALIATVHGLPTEEDTTA